MPGTYQNVRAFFNGNSRAKWSEKDCLEESILLSCKKTAVTTWKGFEKQSLGEAKKQYSKSKGGF